MSTFTCHDVQDRLGAYLDGELSSSDAALVEAHLQNCEACRNNAAALREQHQLLGAIFSPMQKSADAVPTRATSEIDQSLAATRRRISWMGMGLSAAAGFVVAMILLQPPKAAPAQHAIGHLSLATGQVEVKLKGEEWRTLATGGDLSAGMSVRTPAGVRCEVNLEDGSSIRLNSETQCRLDAARTIALDKGQTWSSVAHSDKPFTLTCPEETFVAVGTKFDVRQEDQVAHLTVLDGSVSVKSSQGQETVGKGEAVEVKDGAIGRRYTPDLLETTQWVTEILRLKGVDDPELTARVNGLLAELGQTKMEYLREQQIRELGDHCVLPLCRYVQSPVSTPNVARREQAARILSDLAPPWLAGDLIGLLSDDDEKVRTAAGDALKRLTHLEMGVSDWTSGTPEQKRKAAIGQWSKWWDENRERIGSR